MITCCNFKSYSGLIFASLGPEATASVIFLPVWTLTALGPILGLIFYVRLGPKALDLGPLIV